MSFETLLDGKTVLQNCTVTISGHEIIIDDVNTLEFNADMNVFGVFGKLEIRDTYDINNSGLVDLNGDNTVKISLTDFSGTRSVRTFRVLNIHVSPQNNRFKVMVFELRDEISFILNNTFLSKSFNKTPQQAFADFWKHLNLDAILKQDKMVLNNVDVVAASSFVVPQNVSVLEFFTERFRQDNVHFYQNRNEIRVENIKMSNLKLGKTNSGKDILYTNGATNSQYLYLINDFQESKNNSSHVLTEYPNKKTFTLNTDKILQFVTKNTADVLSELSLNSSTPKFPTFAGSERYDTQVTPGTLNQDRDLFDALTKNNDIHVVVPGDLKNANPGTLVNIDMKGNILNSDSVNKGDVKTGGKYLIHAVTDRIITDKLIHRLTLRRVDSRISR